MPNRTTTLNLYKPVGSDRIGDWALTYDTSNWDFLDHVALLETPPADASSSATARDNTFSGRVTATHFSTSGSSGTVTASSFIGDGTNVTNVNAATVNSLTVNTAVPSGAVFTDTKNTTCSADSSAQLYLIGAASQTDEIQTYSHSTTYVDTNGILNSPYICATGTGMSIDCGGY